MASSGAWILAVLLVRAIDFEVKGANWAEVIKENTGEENAPCGGIRGMYRVLVGVGATSVY